MRRLTDPERETAARLYPEAVRHCLRFSRTFGLSPDEADAAASPAVLDTFDDGRSIESRCYFRCLQARRDARPRSARGLPDFAPLRCDPPSRPDDDGPSPAVVAALRTLPPRQWDAVDYAILWGLGPTGAAEVLGVRKQAVQINLRIALSKLRTLLETA